MGLGKLFDFSGLEFTDFGHESIFHKIHFLIAVNDQAIGIYAQKIFSGEIKLHFAIVIGFEDGLRRQPVFSFFGLVCTYSHFQIIVIIV